MPNHTVQNRPLSVEDLSAFEGQWVALRDGRIVAHAETPAELREMSQVNESDILILVPDHSTSAVFL